MSGTAHCCLCGDLRPFGEHVIMEGIDGEVRLYQIYCEVSSATKCQRSIRREKEVRVLVAPWIVLAA